MGRLGRSTPARCPPRRWQVPDLSMTGTLLHGAVLIAAVSYIISISIVKNFASKHGHEVRCAPDAPDSTARRLRTAQCGAPAAAARERYPLIRRSY